MFASVQARQTAGTCDELVAGLVVRGHYVGKEGAHIDGRLQKQRLFEDVDLQSVLLQPLIDTLKNHKPTLIVGEKNAAAQLAQIVGSKLGVPFLAVDKNAYRVTVSPLADLSNVVILEDNLISGRSVVRLNKKLGRSGINVSRIICLFNSNGSGGSISEIAPLEIVFDLDIQSWTPPNCALCAEFGAESLTTIGR